MQNFRNKFIAMGVLFCILLIALAQIDGLVEDRQSLQAQVQQDIARGGSGQQHVVGPIMVATFEEHIVEKNDKKESENRPRVRRYQRVLLPKNYQLDSDLDTEYRQLGIYKALLYQSKNKISGSFQVPHNWWSEDSDELLEVALVVAITDVRGIKDGLTATLNQQPFELQPGTGLPQLGSGTHIAIEPSWLRQQEVINFKIALNLDGMKHLKVSPVGRETRVNISANWPHTNFVGHFLPRKPTITSVGFAADWKTTFFATNMPDLMKACIERKDCDAMVEASLGVSLIDPVNQYLKTDRAIKYADLFILLTLFAFMLFEIFRRLAIHPIQYAFVGVAMAIFYLLLLSLSEHINFNIAYFISSVSCSGILAIYISGVLGELKHGLFFGGGVLMLYMILFGLLASEDFALLMGSIFVFLVLTVVMLMTRNVNWYALDVIKKEP